MPYIEFGSELSADLPLLPRITVRARFGSRWLGFCVFRLFSLCACDAKVLRGRGFVQLKTGANQEKCENSKVKELFSLKTTTTTIKQKREEKTVHNKNGRKPFNPINHMREEWRAHNAQLVNMFNLFIIFRCVLFSPCVSFALFSFQVTTRRTLTLRWKFIHFIVAVVSWCSMHCVEKCESSTKFRFGRSCNTHKIRPMTKFWFDFDETRKFKRITCSAN